MSNKTFSCLPSPAAWALGKNDIDPWVGHSPQDAVQMCTGLLSLGSQDPEVQLCKMGGAVSDELPIIATQGSLES